MRAVLGSDLYADNQVGSVGGGRVRDGAETMKQWAT